MYFIRFQVISGLILWAISFLPGEDTLMLNDCIELAKNNNRELIQNRFAIEEAQAGLMGAYSSFYPDLNLYSNYRYNQGSNFSTGVGLGYTLFNGGRRRADVEMAGARIKIARANYNLAEIKVVLEVKKAFFEILQKEEQRSLIKDILRRREEDLVIIKLRYEAGRENQPAVKEAEANLLQAEYDRMVADRELTLAQTKLNFLLGRSSKEPIFITYQEQKLDFPPLEEMVKTAQSERPEILRARADYETYEAQIKQARSNYFPSISFSSSYGWQGNQFLNQESDWSAGVNLSLPIFTGFSRRSELKRANIALRTQKIEIENLKATIEKEVEESYFNFKLAQKSCEVRLKTLEAAREMYYLTRLQYEQGLTSYFFLQQKENSLTRAEYEYINALYNLRNAQAGLEAVLGRNK